MTWRRQSYGVAHPYPTETRPAAQPAIKPALISAPVRACHVPLDCHGLQSPGNNISPARPQVLQEKNDSGRAVCLARILRAVRLFACSVHTHVDPEAYIQRCNTVMAQYNFACSTCIALQCEGDVLLHLFRSLMWIIMICRQICYDFAVASIRCAYWRPKTFIWALVHGLSS